MSLGFSIGDPIAIFTLVTKVYTAYKDAPEDYQNISKEVKALRGIISKAMHHLKSPALSKNDQQDGQDALKSCQGVLEDLNSHIIEKYKNLDSTNRMPIIKRVKLGTEDIVTLRARLTSNATLLSSFIRRFDI